jgi:tetratricopeptide (TPR) repeat protein
MKVRHRKAESHTVLFLVLSLCSAAALAREKDAPATRVTIDTGRAGCTVELDAALAGKTDAQGRLVLPEVDATDHYIHVRCPDETHETAYLVSPRVGENAQVRHTAPAPIVDAAATSNPSAAAASNSNAALDRAEAKIKLRELVKDAVQLRVHGRLEEAVSELREAAKLDPENSDLHRELGITFLLDKDWKRARVEMLEAIRHDPTDADAHNGLGYALEKLGEFGSALNEYRTATHLEPDDLSYQQHYLEALARLAAERAEKKK